MDKRPDPSSGGARLAHGNESIGLDASREGGAGDEEAAGEAPKMGTRSGSEEVKDISEGPPREASSRVAGCVQTISDGKQRVVASDRSSGSGGQVSSGEGGVNWADGFAPWDVTRPESASLTVQELKLSEEVRQMCQQMRTDDDELADGEAARTGRWGEALVHAYLLQATSRLTDECRQGQSVTWMNQHAESGAPYDMVIVTRVPDDVGGEVSRKDFVEVKSSIAHDKGWFEISPAELDFAGSKADQYHVFRVYGIGTASPKLVKISDPISLWSSGKLAVRMLV
eukprot:gene4298-5292_t